MWKFSKIFVLTFTTFMAFACVREPRAVYKYNSKGFYYRVLAFRPETKAAEKTPYAWLCMSFCTQRDSVFWDSFNNFNDLYVKESAESGDTDLVASCLEWSSVNDSLLLLIPVQRFFSEQFGSKDVPGFCGSDTVVKVYLKLKEYLSLEKWEDLKSARKMNEDRLIRNYFASDREYREAFDSSGIYWVQKPVPFEKEKLNPGDKIKLNYQGYFLNGRVFDSTGENPEFLYGMPDQTLKGLNYVMPYLKAGQTVKIILPSPLAFGEKGSNNGTVPPFTPVLYTLKKTE